MDSGAAVEETCARRDAGSWTFGNRIVVEQWSRCPAEWHHCLSECWDTLACRGHDLQNIYMCEAETETETFIVKWFVLQERFESVVRRLRRGFAWYLGSRTVFLEDLRMWHVVYHEEFGLELSTALAAVPHCYSRVVRRAVLSLDVPVAPALEIVCSVDPWLNTAGVSDVAGKELAKSQMITIARTVRDIDSEIDVEIYWRRFEHGDRGAPGPPRR